MSIAGGRGRSQLNKYRQIQIQDEYTSNIESQNKKCTNTHKLCIEQRHNSCALFNLVTKRKKCVYLARNCKLRVEQQTSAVFQTNIFLWFRVRGSVAGGVNDRKVFLQSVQCHKTDAADRLYWECYGMALWPLSLITSSQRTQFVKIGKNRGKQLHTKYHPWRHTSTECPTKNAIYGLPFCETGSEGT